MFEDDQHAKRRAALKHFQRDVPLSDWRSIEIGDLIEMWVCEVPGFTLQTIGTGDTWVWMVRDKDCYPLRSATANRLQHAMQCCLSMTTNQVN